MPMSNYDQYFGGEPGSAQKAYDAMVQEYGEEKGKSVFYATLNKKKGKVSKVAGHGPLFE